MTNSVFVMGATGRVGSAVVSSLAGKAAVRAATSRAPGAGEAEWVRFSLEREDAHEAALAGIGAIFLMRPPQITRAAAFVPFLQAARARGIRRCVVLSVAGAESNPLLPHHGVEKLVMQMGFDWTMIRPSDFMQNLETVHLDSIRGRNEIAVPAGRGRSAFVDVADIGEVVAKVLLENGHTEEGYTLTGPVALSFPEVAAALSSVLGRTIRYRSIGVPRFLLEQRQRQAPIGLSLVMAALYTVQRMGLAAGVTEDLPMLLGRPAHDLGQFLLRHRDLWLPPETSA